MSRRYGYLALSAGSSFFATLMAGTGIGWAADLPDHHGFGEVVTASDNLLVALFLILVAVHASNRYLEHSRGR